MFNKLKIFLGVLLALLVSACSSTTTSTPDSSQTSAGSVVVAETGEVIPFEDLAVVSFAFDSSSISQTEREKLDMQAEYIKNNNIATVEVEGHTDQIGTREYNLALGQRRALAVKNYLASKGVPASSIEIVSYGKERLLNTSDSSSARAANRRAVTVLK